MAQRQRQLSFVAVGGESCCLRCGRECKVAPVPGSRAKMLKKASVPKGLCLNCAVHDTLRHLYPANITLYRSAGRTLLHPEAQRDFFELAVMYGTDARFEDIDWPVVVANWDLPFPHKLKRTPTNPVTQAELDAERKEGDLRRSGNWKPPLTDQEQRARDMGELKEATADFLKAVRGERHEDPPPDHRDGD